MFLVHDFPFSRNRLFFIMSLAKVESDADLDAFVRAKSDSAYHPSCTCKMGDDDMAVVDNAGKVCDDDNTIMSRPTLTIKAN